jgi:hypothetical protein
MNDLGGSSELSELSHISISGFQDFRISGSSHPHDES